MKIRQYLIQEKIYGKWENIDLCKSKQESIDVAEDWINNGRFNTDNDRHIRILTVLVFWKVMLLLRVLLVIYKPQK